MSRAERLKAQAESEAELARSREAMAENNAKVMEAQNSAKPSPTIEEIQKALAPRAPRKAEEPKVEQELVDAASDANKTDKSSTAEKVPGGNYKTRDMSAKK